MKMKPQKIARHSASSGTSRYEGRQYLRQAFRLRVQKQRAISCIFGMGFKPVLNGRVTVFDVLTPPGGWDRIHMKYPRFASFSPAEQIRIALNE